MDDSNQCVRKKGGLLSSVLFVWNSNTIISTILSIKFIVVYFYDIVALICLI